jgi:hypothetical protein
MQGRKNKLALLNSFTQFQHDTSLHLSFTTLLPIYDAVIRPAMLTFETATTTANHRPCQFSAPTA